MRFRHLPPLALALAALGAAAGPAHATCYSASPASQLFPDSTADGDAGLAPEISGVRAALSSTCGIEVEAIINNRPSGSLIDGDSAGIYMDTDGNPATGSPTFTGADRVVIIVGQSGADLAPGLGIWTGTDFSFTGTPALPTAGMGGFRSDLNQLGVAGSTTLGIRTISLWEGIYDNYADFAPEVSATPFAFPVAFSTTAPPPPPAPPAFTPPPPPAAPLPDESAAVGCKVPRVRNLTQRAASSKLRRAGCRTRVVRVFSVTVRKGRVVSTFPGTGRRTARAVALRISRGKRGLSARSAAATQYAAIEARLEARVRGLR